jgi:DNA polymerase family B
MRSNNAYGQQKAKRARVNDPELLFSAPMRLRGGAMGAGGGRGRAYYHTLWDGRSGLNQYHYHTVLEDMPTRAYGPRIIEWLPAWNPAPTPPFFNYPLGGVPTEWKDGYTIPPDAPVNDLGPSPGDPPTGRGNVRINEIKHLWVRGDYIRQHNPAFGGGPDLEPLWAFLGMDDTLNLGTAWSCFYYTLSDLYIGGFPTFAYLISTLTDILADVLAVGQEVVGNDSRCLIHFEGITNSDMDEGRQFIQCNSLLYTLGNLTNNPQPVFDQVMNKMVSNNEFLFYRVYVHVHTNLGGAGLKHMPDKWKKLREGPFFAGRKGYFCVLDPEDGSCGISAVLVALSNTMKRIVTIMKQSEELIPSLCQKFSNYRKFLKNGKLSSKLKSIEAELKLEMAGYLGWRKNEPIKPQDLCTAFTSFAQEHKLDLGLVILDAITPVGKHFCSYDPGATIPQHILVLIHWEYPTLDGGLPTGHYDCINTTNVTSWIQSRTGGKARKDVRFSFRQFRLIPTSQADDKGHLCVFCKHWQYDASAKLWGQEHGGSMATNSFLCEECGVQFKSEVCFNLHRKKSHGNSKSACESQISCDECGKLHQSSYDCTMWYCDICCSKFLVESRPSHRCYLYHVSERKKGRLRDVIYSDMEGSRAANYHKPICVASYWTCLCDEHRKKLDKSLCQNCKKNQSSWEWFCPEHQEECKKCDVPRSTYFEGDNCLEPYLEWLMTKRLGSTVVFHNGGKYDLQMIYIELLSTSKYAIRRDAMRGSQIIFMTAKPLELEHRKRDTRMVRFIDSCGFISSSLRNFTNMFGLKGGNIKGRFPYDLLNQKNWKEAKPVCPPPQLFGISDKELKHIEKLSDTRRKEVEDILEYIKEEEGKEWPILKKLKLYTIQDVRLLHDGCEQFRKNFWLKCKIDPFQLVTLASAVAFAYRQEEFMPISSIQTFDMENRIWQHQALRGGKCETFKLYWKKTKPTENLYVFDINSQYPFVQSYGYYPYGAMTCELKYNKPVSFMVASKEFWRKTGIFLHDVLEDYTGSRGCGIIECEVESGDAFFPILPFKIKCGSYSKNMFFNHNGTWIGFMNILAAAIYHKQVIVKSVTRLHYWGKVSNTLFRKFMLSMYAAKVESSGWAKILNDEKVDEKQQQEFIEESARRGVDINPENIKENPGMRSTTKLGLNSGWGYLCQRAHANENLFFDNDSEEDQEKMIHLLETLETEENPRRMVGLPTAVGKYSRVRTTKKAEDITRREMNKNIAYHVGGQVPAHGMVLISNAILSLHPSQVVYTDTDSVMFVYDSANPLHKMLPTGNYLGDFVDEYPDYNGVEWCCTGSKSYFIKFERKSDSKILYKGRFKGIPMNSASFSLLDNKGDIAKLNMEEMKNIIFSALKAKDEDADEISYEVHYTNYFKRNSDFKIRAVEEKKTIRFTFDKRDVIVPMDPETLEIDKDWLEKANSINTKPKCDATVDKDSDDIFMYWRNIKIKIEDECTK